MKILKAAYKYNRCARFASDLDVLVNERVPVVGRLICVLFQFDSSCTLVAVIAVLPKRALCRKRYDIS
jgi:hypothetical protein